MAEYTPSASPDLLKKVRCRLQTELWEEARNNIDSDLVVLHASPGMQTDTDMGTTAGPASDVLQAAYNRFALVVVHTQHTVMYPW